METISLPFASFVFQTLGLPGLIFIVWWWDHKAQVKQREQDREEYDKQQAIYKEQQQLYRDMYEKEQQKLRETYDREHRIDRDMVTRVLCQYKEDINNIASLYKNNVHLVGDYEKAMCRLEKMAEEMMSVVSLNAQSNTHLADAIRNNTFCPQIRKELGK